MLGVTEPAVLPHTETHELLASASQDKTGMQCFQPVPIDALLPDAHTSTPEHACTSPFEPRLG